MKTTFQFGRSRIDLSLPDQFACTVLENRCVEPLPNIGQRLADALDHPLGSPPLTKLAAGIERVAIVVCDITRPVPNTVTLPAVLERLHLSGVRKDGITVLIATGLHRIATPKEVEQIVGIEIAQSYRIISNDAKASNSHRNLGMTSRGTPVLIHKEFTDADLRITMGLIEQHLMAGFSGGRKLVAPGVAAEETIKSIHSHKFMRDVRASEGLISDNPLHSELLEIAQMARHDFILDVTLTRARKISGIFAGNPVVAHAGAVRFLEQSSLVHVGEPADVVITSAAGFPLDLTFYQTIKAVTAAQKIVKDGGRILVISECAEGVGSPEFAAELGAMQSFKGFLDRTANSPVKVDQWQLEKLALAGLRNDIYYFTPGLAPSDLGYLGRRASRSLEEALEATMAGMPSGTRVYLIPDGPYTFARSH